MFAFLTAFGFISVMITGSSFLGRLILGNREIYSAPFFKPSIQIAIGSLILSYAVFVLACLHTVSPNSLRWLFTIVSVLALFEITCFFAGLKNRWVEIARTTIRTVSRNDIGFAILFMLLTIWTLIQTILPPSDRDELIYHLAVPKEIFASGGFKLFPDNIYACFPQLGEMFFVWSMGVLNKTGSEIASKLHHVSFGFLLVLTLYGYARSYLPRKYSFLAALLLLITPSITATFPLAYVDLTFALYAFLALLCLQKFLETPTFFNSVLLGLFCGAAGATKYTGISYAAIILCVILIYRFLNRQKPYLRYVPIFLAISGVVILPYLARNFYFTGWPLFPFSFLGGTIREGINWDRDRSELFVQFLTSFGARVGQGSFLQDALGPILVFINGKFNSPEHFDGVLGPVFLLIPFLLWKKINTAQIKFLLVFTALFFFYWVCTTKQVRFLFPLLPVLCFLLAYGVYESRNKRTWLFVLLPFMLTNIWQGTQETFKEHPLAYLSGKESRENYLVRQWGGLAMYFEANKRLAYTDQVYLIHMKNYVYYLDCPWRADFIFERYWLEKTLEHTHTPLDLLNRFEQRGITHLLINEELISTPPAGLEGQPKELFEKFLLQQTTEIKRLKHFALLQLGSHD